MATTTRRPVTKRPAGTAGTIVDTFKQWFKLKDTKEQIDERQKVLRDRQLEFVKKHGQKDEKGNYWYDLPEVESFKDHKGKVLRFTTLKAERHLKPAIPQPDPDKSIELLQEKGLWLTEEQLNTVRDLQIQCPYVTIFVEVDVEQVALLAFKDIITDEEYESLLVEQTEEYQFRPAEAK
jgi:hypothetical protein